MDTSVLRLHQAYLVDIEPQTYVYCSLSLSDYFYYYLRVRYKYFNPDILVVSNLSSFPVSDSLTVLDGNSIYRTEEWQKAAVLYTYGDEISDTSDPELAIYLWHKRDGKWNRKQKYSIRSMNGWAEDREVLERLLNAFENESISGEFTDPNTELPVSDYYDVSAGVTIFKTAQWWKAGVVIGAKGEYEMTEVILYVWQRSDDEWKVRQKYVVKRLSDWEDDLEALSPLLDKLESEPDVDLKSRVGSKTPAEEGEKTDRERLQKAMERRHLTRELTETK